MRNTVYDLSTGKLIPVCDYCSQHSTEFKRFRCIGPKKNSSSHESCKWLCNSCYAIRIQCKECVTCKEKGCLCCLIRCYSCKKGMCSPGRCEARRKVGETRSNYCSWHMSYDISKYLCNECGKTKNKQLST